ncbi:MAG: hypothetical protein KGZ25_07705 [Planctomycetes bacterium]|nr:hypothetical protein [Planctomycetota bacterium]
MKTVLPTIISSDLNVGKKGRKSGLFSPSVWALSENPDLNSSLNPREREIPHPRGGDPYASTYQAAPTHIGGCPALAAGRSHAYGAISGVCSKNLTIAGSSHGGFEMSAAPFVG